MKNLLRTGALAIALVFISVPTFAATVTLELNTHFGDVAAGTVTVELIDISANTVRLNVTANDMGLADITGLYLNIGNGVNPINLQFNYLGSSGPEADSIIHDPLAGPEGNYQADGDGLYDMVFSWDNDTFNDGETSAYNITRIGGLVAADFFFLSTEGGEEGTYFAAAKIQSTGPGQLDSDWVGAPIPIPAAVWLFGSGLGLLGWMRRKSIVAK